MDLSLAAALSVNTHLGTFKYGQRPWPESVHAAAWLHDGRMESLDGLRRYLAAVTRAADADAEQQPAAQPNQAAAASQASPDMAPDQETSPSTQAGPGLSPLSAPAASTPESLDPG
jgi:hypothetical protein